MRIGHNYEQEWGRQTLLQLAHMTRNQKPHLAIIISILEKNCFFIIASFT